MHSFTSGSLDRAIDSWLGTRRKQGFLLQCEVTDTWCIGHLALHCAVMSEKSSPDLIKYLIQAVPGSLESKSASGHTSLSLAFSLGKLEAVETLIAAGADQTTQDLIGRNILHLALCGVDGQTRSDIGNLRGLIQLTNKRILSGLFLERCQEGPGALTPLARWLLDLQPRYSWHARVEPAAALEALSEFISREQLCMMDGSGQLPLHQAVKMNSHGLAEVLIKMNPSLLFYENAMGQTPLELADSLYVRPCTDKPSSLDENRNTEVTSILDRDPATFLPDYIANDDPPVVKVWKICKQAAAENPHPRKLVSVMDATEVARRPARRKKEPQSHHGYRHRYGDEDCWKAIGLTESRAMHGTAGVSAQHLSLYIKAFFHRVA